MFLVTTKELVSAITDKQAEIIRETHIQGYNIQGAWFGLHPQTLLPTRLDYMGDTDKDQAERDTVLFDQDREG